MADQPRTIGDDVRVAIPSEDRLFDLFAAQEGESDAITILGWADNMVVELVKDRDGTVIFDVTPAPRRSHADEVLVIALRVPHPDRMTLAEVVGEHNDGLRQAPDEVGGGP